MTDEEKAEAENAEADKKSAGGGESNENALTGTRQTGAKRSSWHREELKADFFSGVHFQGLTPVVSEAC